MNIPYVALENLKRKVGRTWLLAVIVAVVSCTLFAATLFLRSINNAIGLGAYRLGADILVVPAGTGAADATALLSGEPAHFLMDSSVLDRINTVNGVKNAAPQIFIKPASPACCFNVDVLLVAFDPESDFAVRPWLDRNLKRGLGPAEVVAGPEVPVTAGDHISLFGTTFTVAGTMEPTGMGFFDRSVFMSLDAAHKMTADSGQRSPRPLNIGTDRISAVLVQVSDDASPDRVALHIDRAVAGVKALVPDVVISTVRKQLSGMAQAIVIISAVLWLIVLLIMSFAFYMIVNERRREIGLLRAMGANRGHVASIFLIEAAYLSAAGGAAGIVLGYGVLFGFKNLMLHYLRLPYLFPGFGELAVLTVGALVMSLATGLAAALLPSIAALAAEPYAAIRKAE